MKRVVALLFAICLALTLTVGSFAVSAAESGETPEFTVQIEMTEEDQVQAPPTGDVALVITALALFATAGVVIIARRRHKDI